MKLRNLNFLIIIFILIAEYPANAHVDKWLEIIKQTKVAVQYFSPVKSESFKMIQEKSTKENVIGLIKEFSDENLNVKLAFKKFDSHIELFGEV